MKLRGCHVENDKTENNKPAERSTVVDLESAVFAAGCGPETPLRGGHAAGPGLSILVAVWRNAGGPASSFSVAAFSDAGNSKLKAFNTL